MFGRNLFDQAKSILYTVQLFTEDSTAKENPGMVQWNLQQRGNSGTFHLFFNSTNTTRLNKLDLGSSIPKRKGAMIEWKDYI